MERVGEILRYIGRGTRGIEIAPWFSPIVSSDGTREAVVLDILDRPALVARAEADPLIDKAMIAQIGEVDLIGSAGEIAELACASFGPDARFDFVVSSHNLEHLPDPLRFLRGCQSLLVPGGILAMAVPDKRTCFDFFRPHSCTGEILQAFHERRERPTFAQTFGQGAYSASIRLPDGDSNVFSIEADPNQIRLAGDLTLAYTVWRDLAKANDTVYHDTHCWTFTPASLELILTELILLELIDFEIVSITDVSGCEFMTHLRKRAENAPAQSGLAGRREVLLHQTIDELACSSRRAWGLRGRTSLQRSTISGGQISGAVVRSNPIFRRIGRCLGF